ncbi:hypothetical protein NPX13_g3246 [Xylaria arbuscula]|uniref:Uncharacterized protein n=1 Tax=Xylaria arbuscula TaxID=114810 RepID=A0A9W8NHN7_9PEZI|nr:hypothetical protein NPX13_g3246 [Xylaria arbuscula]
MTLTAPAIIGLVSLLLMSIPGIKYIFRKLRRMFRSRRNQTSSNDTALPLSGPPSLRLGEFGGGGRGLGLYFQAIPSAPIEMLGINSVMMHSRASDEPMILGLSGNVAVSMSAAVFWPAVSPQLRASANGRPVMRTAV